MRISPKNTCRLLMGTAMVLPCFGPTLVQSLVNPSNFRLSRRKPGRVNVRSVSMKLSSTMLKYQNDENVADTVDGVFLQPKLEKDFVMINQDEVPAIEVGAVAADGSTTAAVAGRTLFHDRLAQQEMKFLVAVQQMPAPIMKPLSLMVHYSLSASIVTPILAMVAWMVSLPKAASLICFVCAQDIINQAVKWTIQRPRPRWYDSTQSLRNPMENSSSSSSSKSWESDFSFPSAHTQFFSGLAFCIPLLFNVPLTLPRIIMGIVVGCVIGLTRNYLGVHWPTDTMFGLLLGGVLGVLWGTYDPYRWLLQISNPAASFGVATAMTGSLISLLMMVRKLSPSVPDQVFKKWCDNVMKQTTAATSSSVDDTDVDRSKKSNNLPRVSRQLRTKLAMFSTIWCTLASTAFLCSSCTLASSSILLKEGASLASSTVTMATAEGVQLLTSQHRIVQSIVGLGGLMGTSVILKKSLANYLVSTKRWKPIFTKLLWKTFAYAGVCAWTFLLTQLVTYKLLSLV